MLETPSGLCRERSLRAYDGVANVVGNPSPAISGFPKPSPIRWFKRVSAATSFYAAFRPLFRQVGRWCTDRKSTRLNSSHLGISYAVFCLKKKKTIKTQKCAALVGAPLELSGVHSRGI